MTSPTLAQIAQLTVPERIQLVEDIWDSIAAEPKGLTLTEPQQEELERRLQAFDQNPQTGSSWNEVKARITGK